MYGSREKLVLFDADGTTVDAFSVIEKTFSALGMEIGDLERFQKRRNLMKYLGGLKEFPVNLKRQLGKLSRKQVIETLTDCYREQGQLYPGVGDLIRTLLATPGFKVGLVTRNITAEPDVTLRTIFLRHGLDIRDLHFFASLGLREDKTHKFREARERFDINPARSYVCGDEYRDYAAAITCGMQPFIVSYGFESARRLTHKFDVPEEVIAPTPQEFCARLRHALDLPCAAVGSANEPLQPYGRLPGPSSKARIAR